MSKKKIYIIIGVFVALIVVLIALSKAGVIGNKDNSIEFYTGYIDDLRITKGFARYTSAFTPPAAALDVK